MTGRVAVTTVVGLAACVQAASQPAESPTLRQGGSPAGEWVAGSFTGPAGSRDYQLYIPGSHDPAKPAPLVVMLHGCTQDPMDFARGSRIAEHADRDGFLALLPAQPATANPMKCWSWFDARHQSRDAGEPAIIAGLTAEIAARHGVDDARIHLGGISAGGAMASLVAVAYPELYASVALHSAPAWRAATSVAGAMGVMANGVPDADALGVEAFGAMGERARGIPVLVIHGSNDAVVKPVNGGNAARQWAVTNGRALGTTPLTAAPATGESNGYQWTRVCHLNRDGACLVEELTIDGLGHAWSGGSAEGTFTDVKGPDATGEMVRFFGNHPKADQ